MHQAIETFHIVKDPDHPEFGEDFVVKGAVYPSNHSYISRAPNLFAELHMEADPGGREKPTPKKGATSG